MESVIEKYLQKEIEKRGGMCRKFISPGFTGVADRLIFISGGILILVETKDTGKTLRKRQDYVKRQFEKLGFIVYKIDSKNQVDELVEKLYSSDMNALKIDMSNAIEAIKKVINL